MTGKIPAHNDERPQISPTLAGLHAIYSANRSGFRAQHLELLELEISACYGTGIHCHGRLSLKPVPGQKRLNRAAVTAASPRRSGGSATVAFLDYNTLVQRQDDQTGIAPHSVMQS